VVLATFFRASQRRTEAFAHHENHPADRFIGGVSHPTDFASRPTTEVQRRQPSSVMSFSAHFAWSSAFSAALVATTLSQAEIETAFALQNQPVYQLDRFVVTDTNSLKTTLPVRPVAGVYGYDVPYQDIARSITQINPQQFASDIISSYSDFTRYSPSVNQATGQLANYGSPTIRGSITDVYQNGIRMLVRQSNNRPFTLNAYEAADIVAGPAPVIFGPSARTSGYVNYLTKKPSFDDQHTTLSLVLGKIYFDGTGFKNNENFTLDTTGAIVPGKLGYRISYQAENVDSYYRNVNDRYHDIYATLAWIVGDNLTVDWNLEYGTFDWKVNNGVNRVTNDFVRDGTYLAGPATPIIQVGTGYFSPVLDANGVVNGWIRRTKTGNRFVAGAATGDPTSNSSAGAGTIVGYVLDPAVVRPVKLGGTAALNAPGFPSTTDAFNTQVRVKKLVGPDLTLLNNAIFQYYKTDTSSNGGFYNWITTHTVEDRTEALYQRDYEVLKLPVEHRSNTGFSYRFEEVKNYKDSQAAGYGPTGDQYDLTADPSSFTRNAFFGSTVYPFLGTRNDPVLTRYGYLKGFWNYSVVPESPSNFVTAGGSQTGTPGGNLSTATNFTKTHALSLYTQHSLKLGEHWLLDLGARETLIYSHIKNPLDLPLGNAYAGFHDGIRAWNPSSSASLSYKPVSWITLYATYDYVVATNGMTTGSPTWATVNGAPNQYDPAAFHSTSELKEAGTKFELIPSKLVTAITVYQQTRDLTLTTVPGQDPILAKGYYSGVEASVRYQPTRTFSLGLNYNNLSAVTHDQVISAPAAITNDNATNIIGSTSLGLGNWRVTNLPRNQFTLFGSYQFHSGFGVKIDLWVRDSYIANADGSVTVPSEHSVNVGLFYNQPKWAVQLEAQNVTNERNFAGAATVLEPFYVQARYTIKL
jgi:hypothetical protein